MAIHVAHPSNAFPFDVIGRVSNQAGDPLPYVYVGLGGSSIGLSDKNGMFRVEGVSGAEKELVLSYIGYERTVVSLQDYSPTDTLFVTMRDGFTLLGNRRVAEALANSMRSAESVRAFLVDGFGPPCLRRTVGADAAEDDSCICRCPIILEASPPTEMQLAILCDAVLEASRDSCGGGPTLCSFIPEYALRFVGYDSPFDLLISRDCHFLNFQRGCQHTSNGSGGGVECVADDVRALMNEIFDSSRWVGAESRTRQ